MSHVNTLRWLLLPSLLCLCGAGPGLPPEQQLHPAAAAASTPATALPEGGWECWGPDLVDPCLNQLNSVAMLSPTQGWAVGHLGTLLQWDGSDWKRVHSPTPANLNSVAFASATEGWAVGQDGVILHWNGTAWHPYPSPTTVTLTSVALRSPVEGWAVGGNQILHWDGSSWTATTLPEAAISLDQVTLSAQDGWILGRRFGGPWWIGLLLRQQAGVWNQLPYGPLDYPATMAMLKPDDLWLFGLIDSVMMVPGWAHGDGSSWSYGFFEYGFIRATAVLSSTAAWGVGERGSLIRYTGSTWEELASPTPETLNSVAMLSISDGWAVGEAGVILRWDGQRWSRWPGAGRAARLLSVAIGSAGDAWAVGEAGAIEHWNGVDWTPFSSPVTTTLNGVDVISTTAAWAVGRDGAMLRWDGGVWSAVPSPTTADLTAIDLVGPAAGWVVGFNGTRLHWDGLAWQAEASELYSSPDLAAVAMVTEVDGWAVGRAIAQARAGQWECWAECGMPRYGDWYVSIFLNEVAMASPDMGWGVGYGGQVMQWDGITWSVIDSPVGTDANLLGVAAIAWNDAWAVGDEWDTGVILHWNGRGWARTKSPTTSGLQAVALQASGGWAVGQGGVILRRQGPPTVTVDVDAGQPGSRFVVSGSGFSPFASATLLVNGQPLTDTLVVDGQGAFVLALETALADPGWYVISTAAGPAVEAHLRLDLAAPLHQAGAGLATVVVPAGLAFTYVDYMPVIGVAWTQ